MIINITCGRRTGPRDDLPSSAPRTPSSTDSISSCHGPGVGTRLAFQSSHGPGHFRGERVEKGQFVKEKISTFIFLALTCPNDKARVSAFCVNFDICCVLVFTLFFLSLIRQTQPLRKVLKLYTFRHTFFNSLIMPMKRRWLVMEVRVSEGGGGRKECEIECWTVKAIGKS